MAQVQIHLRLPPLLHEKVREIAEEQSVSVNQAIVLLIASSTGGFTFNDPPTEDPVSPQRSSRDADTSGSPTPSEVADEAATA